ncbi:glycosyltransferase [Pelagicoccus sp. SDUM812002]|uniref:CgeB family protein n=1 Tax=Pelagicoccus sp. SDUM812002 TaxID=3041266 RepID=UPI00280FE7FB|nr:glycosyltransferase [Pelagicoccus sp. SDUM812002]MDQ8184112.1 glycosyltransferase [Pelagicoccus sp. SDUM812002]
MKFVLFYHSLLSDWNHGNAHFLRGVVKDLARRGHEVLVLEPADGWSRKNLIEDAGGDMLSEINEAVGLQGLWRTYDPQGFDPAPWIEAADVVLVHEWNEPELVAKVGAARRFNQEVRIYFHDTHHRAVSAPEEMNRYDLSYYDGALVFGESLKYQYRDRGWSNQAWVWHEAADTTWFYPRAPLKEREGAVWIGNWGDDERSEELDAYLLGPISELGIRGRVYGVRYPKEAKAALKARGLEYRGWLPNHAAPEVFSKYQLTVHVPRRFYTQMLPGIPTIRVFEALACGIPLVCAPWDDAEGLFSPGEDYLTARDSREMREAMAAIINDPVLARRLSQCGLETIKKRHTCVHRVDELLSICGEAPSGLGLESQRSNLSAAQS